MTSRSLRFLKTYGRPRNLHSFPTRRSSDLSNIKNAPMEASFDGNMKKHRDAVAKGDRKSTRLNSSHRTKSYAVFCLKKKKNCWSVMKRKPVFGTFALCAVFAPFAAFALSSC